MTNKSLFTRLFITTCSLFVFYALLLSHFITNNDLFGPSSITLTIITLLLLAYLFNHYLSPISQSLSAIDNGISAFKDNDFSLTVHNKKFVEINKIINIYNELANVLRSERMDIFQRELLLDTVIQSTPVALVLTNSRNSIVYSNIAARELFKQTKKIDGARFETLYSELSETLRKATLAKASGLVTDTHHEQNIIYNVDCRQFMLNGSEHSLYLYKNMTSEISRKETDMWKQVIRLISHELNNSLAPISSLTRSAQKIMNQPEHIHMLNEVLETIGKRTKHLHDFISDYAQFARFPKPDVKPVSLKSFFLDIERLLDVNCQFDVNFKTANFDAGQIEQVLINLVKNAKESDSPLEDIELNLTQHANLITFSVCDRGAGLTDKQMKQVLLPFFTTKPSGTGVGLALCNEIIKSHHGELKLTNRKHGGLCVSFSLNLAH
jgi:nitrogen fixation/metabolism regulation signal transduction histidine kinase